MDPGTTTEETRSMTTKSNTPYTPDAKAIAANSVEFGEVQERARRWAMRNGGYTEETQHGPEACGWWEIICAECGGAGEAACPVCRGGGTVQVHHAAHVGHPSPCPGYLKRVGVMGAGTGDLGAQMQMARAYAAEREMINRRKAAARELAERRMMAVACFLATLRRGIRR